MGEESRYWIRSEADCDNEAERTAYVCWSHFDADSVQSRSDIAEVAAAFAVIFAKRDAAIARAEKAEAALAKIDDVRNSIVGGRRVSWPEHIYPLVVALEEAGFGAAGYNEARKLAREQIERLVSLQTRLDAVCALSVVWVERQRKADRGVGNCLSPRWDKLAEELRAAFESKP